ncbi:TPA: SidA/IucD/PvdA family monooxygenase [Escherichia coli]|nr:SidA/IucD/PvdA family monooxygenase [Escherichia coli]
MNHKDWDFVNRRLVAKMLSEMEYEQVFHAESQGDDHYCINLPGAQWRFIAERGIWGWLWIDAQTLRCTDEPVLAQTLLMQLKPVLSMSDATVAEHMQDLYATLLGDLQLLKARRGLSASDLINLDADRLQCLLSGHPKFVFNKGRRGWGKEALERYAPEYTNTFRLHWLAVKREHMIWRCDNDLDIQQLLTAAMDPQEFTRFSQVWQENGLDHNWLPLPVHPWQWQQKIATDFIADFAEGRMVSLGEFGDQWLAQQSLRTLTNASRRGGLDIKLPLTIYNTSCYRGIPGRYIAAGPLASRWLQQVFATDATLVQSGAVILGEPAAGYVSHEGYAALARAPYRYQEMLGVIWRENPCRWLKPDESPVLMATLMECDENNQPLAGAYIDRSGLDAETWLTQLFRVVVVPLYHLLCRYGVALIAHGQNITLAMKEGVPQRVLLKDFQGDMRLVKEEFPEMDSLLKDLVSAVAPTNPYSFVNYLVKHKKFYRFLTSRLRTVSREEFSDYLRWAAEDMNNLYFSHTVENIDFDKKRRLFLVQTSQGEYFARNICLGTGKQPYLPPCVKHMTQSCFHASEMNLRRPDLSGKRITVVGGGQSGADLFLNALRGEWGEAAEINWVSRRNNFNALDEAAFADEYFTPEYISGFSGLEEDIRHQLLDEQKMTSDGITADSLLTIYRELYHRFEVLRKPRNIRLLPSRSVTTLESSGPGWKLLMEHHLDQGRESLESDVVIFATGYRSALPQILPSLMPLITMHDKNTFKVRDDFTLEWSGPKENNIFVVNASMQTHGIAEPQLSLMAWRSARILNRVMGRDLFDLSMPPALIQWRSGT